MKIIKYLKSRLLRQRPLSDDIALELYVKATKTLKPAPFFARDFVRLVEQEHGIIWKAPKSDE